MGLTYVGPSNHVLHGVEIIMGKGNSYSEYAAKGIIQSSITASQSTAMLPTGRCHIILSPVKNLFQLSAMISLFDLWAKPEQEG